MIFFTINIGHNNIHHLKILTKSEWQVLKYLYVDIFKEVKIFAPSFVPVFICFTVLQKVQMYMQDMTVNRDAKQTVKTYFIGYFFKKYTDLTVYRF